MLQVEEMAEAVLPSVVEEVTSHTLMLEILIRLLIVLLFRVVGHSVCGVVVEVEVSFADQYQRLLGDPEDKVNKHATIARNLVIFGANVLVITAIKREVLKDETGGGPPPGEQM